MSRRRKSRFPIGAIFFIPLAFIVYFAVTLYMTEINPDHVDSVHLVMPDGEEYSYTDKDQIIYFLDLIKGAKSITSPIRDLEGETPINLKIELEDTSHNYAVYPQLNLSGCMFTDQNGSLFLLSADDAVTLLTRPELQYMYCGSFLPPLNIVSGHKTSTVTPVEYLWYFKKPDGNYYPDKQTSVCNKEGGEIYSIAPEDIKTLSFVEEPDEFSISYSTQDGEILAIRDISELSFEQDTKIIVSITAKWSEFGGADFFGQANYSFLLLYDIPAAITLEKSFYSVGDLAVLPITHLNENQEVELDTQLDTNLSVINTKDKTYALLPISLKNSTGDYTLTFKIGDRTFRETITIKQEDAERGLLEVNGSEYKDMLSPEALARAEQTLDSVFSDFTAESYYDFGSAFTLPLSGKVLSNYGKIVTITADLSSHNLPGRIYAAEAGTSVKSAQRGKVVFAQALPATGNTLIIDHGHGVMSCYFNLKDFLCTPGDVVQQGEIVASSGSTGFTNEKSFLHFAISVNGVFVNPDTFLK